MVDPSSASDPRERYVLCMYVYSRSFSTTYHACVYFTLYSKLCGVRIRRSGCRTSRVGWRLTAAMRVTVHGVVRGAVCACGVGTVSIYSSKSDLCDAGERRLGRVPRSMSVSSSARSYRCALMCALLYALATMPVLFLRITQKDIGF